MSGDTVAAALVNQALGRQRHACGRKLEVLRLFSTISKA
jgi:hypothetical protein